MVAAPCLSTRYDRIAAFVNGSRVGFLAARRNLILIEMSELHKNFF